MPNSGRDPWKEHLEKRITDGTVYFDIDHAGRPKHATMPSLDIFTKYM
jgi:hypothetical protein